MPKTRPTHIRFNESDPYPTPDHTPGAGNAIKKVKTGEHSYKNLFDSDIDMADVNFGERQGQASSSLAVASSGDGKGSASVNGQGDATADVIPINKSEWPSAKHYEFQLTRGFFFDSNANTITESSTTAAPRGFPNDGNNHSINTYPWSYIPNNNLMLYLSPQNLHRLYNDGAYEFRVKKVSIRGYDAVAVSSNPLSATESSTIMQPLFMTIKDSQYIVQNQSLLGDGSTTFARTATNGKSNFNVNDRQLLHEEQDLQLADYIVLNRLNYWSPNPTTTSTRQTLYDWIPQLEQTCQVNLHKPGQDLYFEHTPKGQFMSLYSQGGNPNQEIFPHNRDSVSSNPYWTRGQIEQDNLVVHHPGRWTNPRGDYDINYSFATTPAVNVDVPEYAKFFVDLSNDGPTPAWLIRSHQYLTPGDNPLNQRIYMLFDYKIEIEVHCKKPRTLGYVQYDWYENGMPTLSWNGLQTTALPRANWMAMNLPGRARNTVYNIVANPTGGELPANYEPEDTSAGNEPDS